MKLTNIPFFNSAERVDQIVIAQVDTSADGVTCEKNQKISNTPYLTQKTEDIDPSIIGDDFENAIELYYKFMFRLLERVEVSIDKIGSELPVLQKLETTVQI